MKLIDKDALVAEIERLSDIISQGMFTDESRLGIEYFKERVLSFLDTLEVREVDLEKEEYQISQSFEGEGLFDGSKVCLKHRKENKL